MRCHQKDSAFAEESAPRLIDIRNSTEVAAGDMRNAVVLGESLVHKGVIRGKQFQHAAILTDDTADKEIEFALQSVEQRVTETWKTVLVGRRASEVADVKPLAREVCDQSFRLRIGQHALNLTRERRGFVQPTCLRGGE